MSATRAAVLSAVFLLFLSAVACTPVSVGGLAAERLYVAPMKLELREQLGLQAKVTGIALHGDRVDVMERRRRFVRIRLGAGTSGWVDGAELLTEQQWAKLARITAQASQQPVEAVAAPFEPLNVHTDPNRQAPTFYVATEAEPVEIVGHIVTPRVDHDPRYAAGYDPETVPAGSPVDDWHLVRIGTGDSAKVGWVLSRLLYMRLPDVVTQQANGAAIMAAISLGRVPGSDDEPAGTHHDHWLLATVTNRNQRFEFDTLRVLSWNTSRHRYDVMFLQKDLIGFYPILLEPAATGANLSATFSGFSVLLETGELQRERRHYTFARNSNRPKLASTETLTIPKPEPPRREDYVAPLPAAPAIPAKPPYWQRVKMRWQGAWSS